MQFATNITEGGLGVVGQLTPESCVSAVGEMLSHGRLTQLELIQAFAPNGGMAYYVELPGALGAGWTGRFPVAVGEFLSDSPVGLVLKVFGQEGHCVVASRRDDVTARILDPWPVGIGSSYDIAVDDINEMVSFVIYQK